MTQLNIDELNKMYTEAEQSDSELFAEQRSNILLAFGEHYAKKNSKFWSRIRDSKELSQETKLRLTKNHIQKITKTYINNILSLAPGAKIFPRNESEIQDQKAAELFSAVWQYIKDQSGFKKRLRELCEDLVVIGEAHVKVFWEPNGGVFLGYQPEIDQETGQPVTDPMTGQMMASKTPSFTGQVIFERVFAFNLLRAPETKSLDDSPYLIYRKMVSVDELKAMVGNDPEKLKHVQETKDETYTVFDAATGAYKQVKDQTTLREYYFRPCHKYPNGYFAYATASGILFEGELPLGVFPIISCGFDEVATSPRARSIIKQIRPYQIELNRTGSKIAETQATSDDKLIIQDGAKISHGGTLPGVRAVKVTGAPPTVLPGRAGEQYFSYVESQIREMYQIANVAEDLEQLPAQLDPYTLLFRSMRNKKKFSLYSEKFEQFIIEITKASLRIAKGYLDEAALIPAIGKKEYINIPEFKSQDDLSFQIKVEEQTSDVESVMGKQITLNHVLQYCGQQLSKDDIGKIIQNMPYVNQQEMFSDLTIDYENSKNDLLSLDRGSYRPAHLHDNHTYVISKLLHRMKQADFEQLPPQIQRLYDMKLQEHEALEAENQRKILAAKNDLIPATGYLVPVDFYIVDPNDSGKTRRARVPYDSLAWLIQRLEDQGNLMNRVENLPDSEKVRLSEAYNSQVSPQQQPQSPFQNDEQAKQAQASIQQQNASGGGF